MLQEITVKEQICSTGNCQSCQTVQVSSKPPQAASVSKQYFLPFLPRQSLLKSDCACPAGHMEFIHDSSTCWQWFWDRSKLEACARSLYRQKPTILKFEHVQKFEHTWASSGTCTHTHCQRKLAHKTNTAATLRKSQAKTRPAAIKNHPPCLRYIVKALLNLVKGTHTDMSLSKLCLVWTLKMLGHCGRLHSKWNKPYQRLARCKKQHLFVSLCQTTF